MTSENWMSWQTGGFRSCWLVMGPHRSCAARRNQVQNRPTTTEELRLQMGWYPASEHSEQVDHTNHKPPLGVRIWPEVKAKSCNWATASPWVLWWKRESVRSCYFPPSGVEEWKLQVRPSPDQVLRCPFEKENDPKTGAHGLLNTYKDIWYLHNVTTVRKHPRLQKNLLGGFLYRLVLDKAPSRQFKPFVSARVAEIQETVGVDDFRYVRSKINPADTHQRNWAITTYRLARGTISPAIAWRKMAWFSGWRAKQSWKGS